MVEEGKPAPDFELTSDSGETVKLSDLRGKPVVLYFYPKDDTPGCTTQACGIRDAYGEFERRARSCSASHPTARRHTSSSRRSSACRSPCSPTPITAVSEAYGVWGEKKYMGRTYMGVSRSTFVIDADGNVKRVMHDVKPDTHADDVLETLKS